MSTIALPRFAATPADASTWQLGRVEARRMLLHPSYLVGLVLWVLASVALVAGDGVGPGSMSALPYNAGVLFGVLFYPLLTVAAANRVAAASMRGRPGEVLAATPLEQRRRTLGAMLGLLRGPVLVGVIVMIYLDVVGPLVPAGAGNLAPRGVLEHLQVPVTILGGGLLGIALARWVRLPGTLPAVIIALWFGTLAFGSAVPWFVLLPTWLLSDDTLAMRSPVSQEMWHLVYLLGLSLLAGVAALLHAPAGRRPLLAAGVVLALVTALAGWLQLG